MLHERIARRFHRMLELGFEQEVRGLFAHWDLTPDMPSMRAVGYRQMMEYLRGNYTREQMIERGIIATRQLAKRQLTWLRADQEANWLDEEAENLCAQALKMIEIVPK